MPQSTFELRDRAVPHPGLGETVAVSILIKGVLLDGLRYDEPGNLVEMQGVIMRLPLRMTEDGLELSAPLRIGELSDARTLEAVGMYVPTRLMSAEPSVGGSRVHSQSSVRW